jgi:hypothetical protein
MLETIRRILSNKKAAESKKGIFGIIAAFVIIGGVIMFFFSGGNAVWGMILGAVALAAILAGTYFWLRAVDDLPDALERM